MATLKGQNFRILLYNSTASKWSVIGMSSNCTVSLGTNTEESSTKDDTGMASKPEVTSKNWQVSVDSLNVADVGTLLTSIKAMTSFTLMWDEVNTTDNQSPVHADFARTGQAFLTDATFSFNDRENSVKNLTFVGSGILGSAPSEPSVQTVSAGSYTKGQFVRLFLGSDNTTTPAAVIAACKQLQFHTSVTVEDATTKDTTGSWVVQEPTAISFDISTNALMRSGEAISSLVDGVAVADVMSIYEAGTPVKFQIANVSGNNNRTKGSVIVSGSVIISSLSLNGPNRANATYDASLTGWGDYTVGA